jgi:MFS family permease
MNTVNAKTPASPGEKAPAYAWVVLLVVFLISVAAPLNQFKAPPVMPLLIGQFKLNMASAGMLMSVFSIAGCLLALPSGAILQKIGLRRTGILSGLFIILGSLLGVYADTANSLLLSRTLEGAGMAVIGVAAPVSLAMWFPPRQRGIAIGIWSAWVSVGVTTVMNIAPRLTGTEGVWKNVWWFGTGFALFAMLLYALLFRNPGLREGQQSEADARMSLGQQFRAIVVMRDVWLVCIALFGFNVIILSMGTFFPTYLMQVRGMSPGDAGFYGSIANMVIILSSPLGGWLSDRLGIRKPIFSCCLCLVALWWIFAFRVPNAAVPFMMIGLGLAAGPIVTTIVTIMPDVVKKPVLFGVSIAFQQLFHHLGEFVGPVFFGSLIDHLGWINAAYIMAPVCLICGIAGFMIKSAR